MQFDGFEVCLHSMISSTFELNSCSLKQKNNNKNNTEITAEKLSLEDTKGVEAKIDIQKRV